MASAGIPVIDISTPSPQAARQVLDAATKHGFLFIQNHDLISPQDIRDMFSLSQKFFACPRDQKEAFAIHSEAAGGVNKGWVDLGGESLDPQGQPQGDPKEAFNIAPPQPALQPLPPSLSSHKDLIARFQTTCHELCVSILSLLGTALGISEPNYFPSRHDQTRGPSGTIFRMLYYPKTKVSHSEEKRIRAGAHSDYGSVTLLCRLPGQPGLELLTSAGWVEVPVNPDPEHLAEPPILVNIGDLLSFWTAGMLKSTVHRVSFSGGDERYSLAYFCHPLDDVKLEPVPSPVIKQFGDEGIEELKSQRKRLGLDEYATTGTLTAKQHLDRRLKVTYGI